VTNCALSYFTSPQKIDVQVRSVNRYMAADAFAAGLESQPTVRYGGLVMKAGVALQAELAAFSAYQQHAIRAPMRVMAGNAALDAAPQDADKRKGRAFLRGN
jgi:hypothetical protein